MGDSTGGTTLPTSIAIKIARAVGRASVVGEPRRRIVVALTEMCEVLGCDMITAAQSRIDPATGATHFEEMVLCGELPDHHKDRVLAYLGTDHESDVFYAAFGRATAGVVAANPLIEAVVFRRQDLVPDSDWYSSKHYRTTRTAVGVDAAIYAGLPTRQRGVWIGSGFHRVQGRPQFSEEDREVVRAFLLGASPLFEAFHAAGKASGPFLATLTSRQREMVYALLEGFSAKEISARLGLTTSSVNTYCKRLYRALGVSGRGELVRLCNERGVFVDGGKAGRGETSA
jgi:DNA-binding CsgD family transcriptional regulator